MGANGAGKSTLLKTLAGILPIDKGEIWFDDNRLTTMSAVQKSQQLAYLAQNTEIHWDLSVYDVIALGLPNPLNRAKEQEKVRSISETFSVSHLLEKSFRQLSGGEKARLALAMIVDGVDGTCARRACVVAIHHLSLAYKFCDEVILLNQGKIIASGETTSVLTAEHLANAFHIHADINQENKVLDNITKLV